MKERISSGAGVTGPAKEGHSSGRERNSSGKQGNVSGKKGNASGRRGFTSERISFNRKMVAASAAVTARKSTIHSLCETDVTLPRRMMREHFERTGEKLSFTAYIVYCLAQVVKEHPHLNAFRRGNRLITLDDVTVSVLVERMVFTGERHEEREFLCLTGSFDHDIVDGAPAARFMNQFLETLKSGMGIGGAESLPDSSF